MGRNQVGRSRESSAWVSARPVMNLEWVSAYGHRRVRRRCKWRKDKMNIPRNRRGIHHPQSIELQFPPLILKHGIHKIGRTLQQQRQFQLPHFPRKNLYTASANRTPHLHSHPHPRFPHSHRRLLAPTTHKHTVFTASCLPSTSPPNSSPLNASSSLRPRHGVPTNRVSIPQLFANSGQHHARCRARVYDKHVRTRCGKCARVRAKATQ